MIEVKNDKETKDLEEKKIKKSTKKKEPDKGKNKNKVDPAIEFYYFMKLLVMFTNENNILKESEISYHIERLIKNELNIDIDEIDRRRIYKYADAMKELKYDISIYKENKKGYFLKTKTEKSDSNLKYRDLEKDEVDMLVASVLSNKYLTKKQQNDLKKKIYDISTLYHSQNEENPIIEKNITVADNDIYGQVKIIKEAMKSNKKVTYDLYRMGYDKKLVKAEGEEKSLETREVTPIGTVIKNDKYYFLFAKIHQGECKIKSSRLDRIKNMKISIEDADDFTEYYNYKTTLKECSDNRSKKISPEIYAKKHMNMYSGDIYNTVKLRTDESVCGYIIEELGLDYDIEIKKSNKKGKYVVSFRSAITDGLVKWILALDNQVEVLEPEGLKLLLIKKINSLYKIYKLDEAFK